MKDNDLSLPYASYIVTSLRLLIPYNVHTFGTMLGICLQTSNFPFNNLVNLFALLYWKIVMSITETYGFDLVSKKINRKKMFTNFFLNGFNKREKRNISKSQEGQVTSTCETC